MKLSTRKRLFYVVTSVIMAAIAVGLVSMAHGIAKAFHDAILLGD